MYLIDTDILSALRRPERSPRIAEWVAGQRESALYLTVITIGEVERGIASVRSRQPAFSEALASWLEQVLWVHAGRILPVDVAVVRRWGRLCARLGRKDTDLIIAATALEHGLTLVTRNVRHFLPTGVRVQDPGADPDADVHALP